MTLPLFDGGCIAEMDQFFALNNYSLVYVVWNLFLLAIPFFLFSILRQFYRRTRFKRLGDKLAGLLCALLWLIFLPNSAYVIVDIRHLNGFCDLKYNNCLDSVWMTLFFFSYSVIGWYAYVRLVKDMKRFVNQLYGRHASDFFIAAIIPTISLGVLLGLINRWNSWDIVRSPIMVMRDAGKYFYDWPYFRNWLIFTFFFFILYLVGNSIFKGEIKNVNT